MFTPIINSPKVPYPPDQSFNIDFNERINSLHTSLINQLESLPKTNSSLEKIFNLIPIIFRFLRKNLQSQQNLFNEYNDLSNTIQKVISICAQYIHDRHDHENELLFLKNKISQILGQTGYTQYCLERYWKIIHSLEYETERLQIFLSNPQLLQINQRKFQIFQETQKIKLDRLIKENEKIKILINKQIHSIKTIQIHIENDIKELQRLKPILYNIESEEKNLHNHWLQIEKQTSHLQTTMEKTKNMENEYNDRIKITKAQYDLVQKQLNTLTNTYNETNQQLVSIQTNETNIKQEIEKVKNDITIEQTHSLTCRDQIQNLRHQTHELELAKRYTHQMLKSEEHTNFTLERKRIILENNQLKFHDRVQNLTTQLNNLIEDNEINEHTISINMIHLENQQYKMRKIEIVLKKLIHLNNNLEKNLHENHFIQLNEQEKLHSIKQISFQKRKQLITQTKHLHILSINKHQLIKNTIQNSLEILRLNNIFHHSNNNEKYFQSILQKKKIEMMKCEKQRTSLNSYLHDNENRIDFLTKKNQLIENELQSKIDHFQLLNSKFLKQKQDRVFLSDKKQYSIYSYRKKQQNLNEIHKKFDQLETTSDYEINHIIKKNQENEQFKLNIQNLKQQIINMMSKTKRQRDEYSLLNEKIHLYTQLNNINNQQQQRCLFQRNHFSSQILNLQQENNRLLNNLQNLQKKTMIITSLHRDNLVKKNNLSRINQILLQRPVIIRDSPMQIHTYKSLEDYTIFVNRLMKIIHQCVQWREKLTWINQLYLTKIEQIHQQTKILSTKNEMILRYKIDLEIKHCKGMKAESRLQTY